MGRPAKEVEATELQQVTSAELHSATRFVGKTESTLSQVKLPGVKMWWVPNEGLLVHHSNQKMLIPSANVKVAYLD